MWPHINIGLTGLYQNHKEQKANLTRRKCYISEIKNKKFKKTKSKWQSGKNTDFMTEKKG